MIANENRLRNELIATVRDESIPFLDLLEALRAATRQPSFEDTDGHPNRTGHRIIAGEVVQWIEAASLFR